MNISSRNIFYRLLKYAASKPSLSFLVLKKFDTDIKIPDVCSFIRLVFFVLLFYFSTFATIILILINIFKPFEYQSILSIYTFGVMAALSIITIVFVIYVLVFLISKILGSLISKLLEKLKKDENVIVEKTPKPATTFQIVLQFIKDKHNKVCTSVTIEDESNDKST